MSIKTLDKEQLAEMSMIEIAYEILREEKTTFSYLDLLKRVAELKEMTEEEIKNKIGYLYTHLNVDGRFVCLGDNVWGLKAWYPMEKLEEDIITQKTKKKSLDEDDDYIDDDEFNEYDEDDESDFEELEDELDDIVPGDEDDFVDEDLVGRFDDPDADDLILDDDPELDEELD